MYSPSEYQHAIHASKPKHNDVVVANSAVTKVADAMHAHGRAATSAIGIMMPSCGLYVSKPNRAPDTRGCRAIKRAPPSMRPPDRKPVWPASRLIKTPGLSAATPIVRQRSAEA